MCNSYYICLVYSQEFLGTFLLVYCNLLQIDVMWHILQSYIWKNNFFKVDDLYGEMLVLFIKFVSDIIFVEITLTTEFLLTIVSIQMGCLYRTLNKFSLYLQFNS